MQVMRFDDKGVASFLELNRAEILRITREAAECYRELGEGCLLPLDGDDPSLRVFVLTMMILWCRWIARTASTSASS